MELGFLSKEKREEEGSSSKYWGGSVIVKGCIFVLYPTAKLNIEETESG